MNTTTAQPSIAMQSVDSSKIHSVGFDAATGTLAIRFKNKDGEPAALYHYRNVTSEDFAALQGAESIGGHFHKAIKPFAEKYPYQRIDA